MRAERVTRDLGLQRALPGSGDVRELAPAAGGVVAGRPAIRRRLEDLDGGGKQDAAALAVEPRAHALAGNGAGDEHDLPMQVVPASALRRLASRSTRSTMSP